MLRIALSIGMLLVATSAVANPDGNVGGGWFEPMVSFARVVDIEDSLGGSAEESSGVQFGLQMGIIASEQMTFMISFQGGNTRYEAPGESYWLKAKPFQATLRLRIYIDAD